MCAYLSTYLVRMRSCDVLVHVHICMWTAKPFVSPKAEAKGRIPSHSSVQVGSGARLSPLAWPFLRQFHSPASLFIEPGFVLTPLACLPLACSIARWPRGGFPWLPKAIFPSPVLCLGGPGAQLFPPLWPFWHTFCFCGAFWGFFLGIFLTDDGDFLGDFSYG